MKRHIVMGALVAVGLCCGLTGSAWAGGIAGDDATCLVNNPGKGALALRGTLAVEVIGNVISGDGTHDVDFTLRLERSGQQHFFRLFLDDTQDFGDLSDRGRVCRILNPADTDGEPNNNQAKVSQFVVDILDAFDIPSDWRLVITKSSISDTDGGSARVIPGTVQPPPPDGFVGRASGLADVTIYAVGP